MRAEAARSAGFNEAGAKSAGKHPEIPAADAVRIASMRPAQKAPENQVSFAGLPDMIDRLQ